MNQRSAIGWLAGLGLTMGACGGQVTMPDGGDPGTNPEATGTTGTGTGNGPTNSPTNVAINTQTNVPTDLPLNTPTNLPLNTPTNVPLNTPTNTGDNLPTNTPINTPTNTPANTPASGCLAGPYLTVGDSLFGYCFAKQEVGNVSTIASTLLDSLTFSYSLPGTSWDDFALLGCNLQQPISGGAGTELPWLPEGNGICVQGMGFSRIQIQGPNGASDPRDRWCAEGPGCVAWTDFRHECWPGAADTTPYERQPLTQVIALQPSLSDGVDVVVTPLTGTICVSRVEILWLF